jgi:hypothetical protein
MTNKFMFMLCKTMLECNFAKVESANWNITRVENGSSTGGWVEGQCFRRDIDDFPANFNSNQVNIIEWWSSRVSEKWCILNPLGLVHRPKSQWPTKVGWFEARQTIREGWFVKILGLGQEWQRASAQAQ